MNPHPIHTGEHLAWQCLDEARVDYSLAVDLILAQPRGVRRDHALRALELWAAFHPVANDN